VKSNRRFLTFAAVALAMALAAPAVARPRGGPPDLGRLEHKLEKLDLDTAVRERAWTILDAARDEERALRTQLRDAHEQLRALLEADAPDLEAVEAQADALGALRTQAHKLTLRTRLEVGALLTPEQREQLAERRHRGKSRGRWLR
jgi:Spy/CpxP family protein refolding chaperone